MERRRVIAGVGSLSTLCLAGCMGSDDSPSEDVEGTDANGNEDSSAETETIGQAETRVVEPGDSIQTAIDETAVNGTVEVQSGTYAQSVTIDKQLLFAAPNGATLDGIDADGNSAVTVAESGVKIEGFEIFDYENTGIRTATHVDELTITDVTLSENSVGLNVAADIVSLANVAVTDNSESGTIESSATGDITVRNSEFVRSDEAGLSIAGGDGIELEHVDALQNGTAGISVAGGNARGQTIELTDATCLENGRSGVSITGTRGDDTVTVETTEAADNGQSGLEITADSVSVTDADLQENSGSGLSIGCSSEGDVTVRGCEVGQAGNYGIHVNGGELVEISDADLRQNGSDQLRVDGGDVRGQTVDISDSVIIENSSGNGLSVTGTRGDDTVSVENVECIDNSYHGIEIAAETVDVTGVEVESGGAADSGLSIKSSSDGKVTVRDTVVTDTERETSWSLFSSNVKEYGYGIHVVDGKTVEIDNVDLQRNEGDQIRIDTENVRGQTVDITNSSMIESASGNGALVRSTKGDDEHTITNCVAEDNDEYGFWLEGEAVVIENTSVSGNGSGPLQLTEISEDEATIRNSF